MNVHLDDGAARRVAGSIGVLLDDLDAHATALSQQPAAGSGGAA